MSMKFKVDNVLNYEKNNGWLCGQFVEDEILKNDDFEVNYQTFLPWYTAEKHSHPKSKMMILILSGKIKMEIDDIEHILSSQDFVFLEEWVPEKILEVCEPTVMLCIRSPSVANNIQYLV